MTRWAEKYMGLRFLDGGRDFPAVDCWGLVCLVFRHEQGIELPPYGDISARDLMSVAREMGAGKSAPPWLPATPPFRAFDIAGMRACPGTASPRSAVVHAGVLTAPGRLLHIEAGQGVHHVPLDHFSVKSRLILFRRHEALT